MRRTKKGALPVGQAMKELEWEYGPTMVTEAEAIVGADPEAIKSLLEANRRYAQDQTLAQMTEDNIGEKVAQHMRKSLRPR